MLRGSSALRPMATSPTGLQRQSPAWRGSSPSLSSRSGTDRGPHAAPATSAWFGGDFVEDLVTSIHSPRESTSPTALERLERLEADAFDVFARSPSPQRIAMMPRHQHWPSAPTQPALSSIRGADAAIGAIGETLTALRRASLQLGAEAAAEVAAREKAGEARRRASVASVRVGVLREYDAAKAARERYNRAAPAREALSLQASPEHDRARRQRAGARSRVAAEHAAVEHATAVDKSRRRALVAEREAGLQATIDRAHRAQGGAAVDRAHRAAVAAEVAGAAMQFAAPGSSLLRTASAAEEAAMRAEEEWSRVLCAEETAEGYERIHFEGRPNQRHNEPSDGPTAGLVAPKKVHTGVKLQNAMAGPRQPKGGPKESRDDERRDATRDATRELHVEPQANAAGASACRLAQDAPIAHAEVGTASVAEEKPQTKTQWHKWAKLKGVAAGIALGAHGEGGSGRAGSEQSAVGSSWIDPLLAPALRTAQRKVRLGKSTAQQSMSASVVELAIEKYGDPTGSSMSASATVAWGIYQDQVFGWGLTKDTTVAKAPQADVGLAVASTAFASSLLAVSTDLDTSDWFGPRRSRMRPPEGVSKGGALQELYQLEALLEVKSA